jgi:hypothetical protein
LDSNLVEDFQGELNDTSASILPEGPHTIARKRPTGRNQKPEIEMELKLEFGNLLFGYVFITFPCLFWCYLSCGVLGDRPGCRKATPAEHRLFGVVSPLLGPALVFSIIVGLAHQLAHSAMQGGDADSLTLVAKFFGAIAAPLISCTLSNTILLRRLETERPVTAPTSTLLRSAGAMILLAVPLTVYSAWGYYRDGKVESVQQGVTRRTHTTVYKVKMAEQEWGPPGYAGVAAAVLFVTGVALFLADDAKSQKSKNSSSSAAR